MSSLEIYQRLRKSQKAVFTLADLALLANQKKTSAAVMANRLVKKEILAKIERGKFCQKDEDAKAVACGIVKPSYISFLSAIFLHNGTTQIPIGLQLACRRNRRPLAYQGEKISFHRMPVAAFTGFELMHGAGGRVYALAGKEKALADSIAYPALCPISEVQGAVRRFGPDLDREKCRQYVALFSSRQAKMRLERVFDDES